MGPRPMCQMKDKALVFAMKSLPRDSMACVRTHSRLSRLSTGILAHIHGGRTGVLKLPIYWQIGQGSVQYAHLQRHQ